MLKSVTAMIRITTLEDRFAVGIWLLVALSGIAANGAAIIALIRSKKRTVGDTLVLHLCILGVLGVTFNVILRPLIWFTDFPHVFVVRIIGSQFFSSIFYQSIICISFDCLLAVRLNLTYKAIVTKSRLHKLITMIWVISTICAVISGIYSYTNTIIWIFWSTVTIISIIASYFYIIRVFYRQRAKFRKHKSCKYVRQFKYEVPFCITLSYILTMFIPDIVVVVDERLFTVWTLVIWYTYFLIYPLVYVFFKAYGKERKKSTTDILLQNLQNQTKVPK